MLSLLIAVVVFVPLIAIVGISPLGPQSIGEKGTLTNEMNTTFWSTYSSFGLVPMALLFISGGAVLLLLLVVVSTKIFKEPQKEVIVSE